MAVDEEPVSVHADEKRGSFKEMLCSRIWWGVIAIGLDFVSNGMIVSYSTTLIDEQLGDNALLYNNIAYVTCSMIFLHACPAFGYISQPHRCGRKWTLMFMAVMNIGYVAVVVFWKSAIWLLVSKVVFGVLGGGIPSPSYMTLVQAWATDWCPPHQKGIAFGFIVGGVTLGMALGGMLGNLIDKYSLDLKLHTSFALAMAHFVFLVFAFPNDVTVVSATSPMPVSATVDIQDHSQAQGSQLLSTEAHQPDYRRRYTIGLSSADVAHAQEIGRVAKLCRDTMFVIKVLFRLPQRRAFIVYILMGLVDTGVHDSCMLFLRHHRGFTVEELGHVPVIMGMAGAAAQFPLVPLLQICGFTLNFMMLFGSVCALGHCLGLAYIADKDLLLVFLPLGSFASLAVIGSLTALSKVSGPAGQNQGLLIGVATGFETLIAASGPLGLAVLIHNYENFPEPFNFAGVGFALLAVILAPGVWCALSACVTNRILRTKQEQSTGDCEG